MEALSKAGLEVPGRSQGSTTNSMGSTAEVTEEEHLGTPSVVDCNRLARIKAEQEQRLKMLRSRIDRLTAQERRVWQDVTWTQQMSLQAQEKQWRRQAQQADRLKLERDLLAQEQAFHDRGVEMRQRAVETKDIPRLQKFEENRAVGKQVREDSKRLMSALQEVREQTLQSKVMQVEVRRQQRRQQKLRKELELAQQEQARQDQNALMFAELQEELQSTETAIAAAERDELNAVQRLQNSQTVHANVLSQLQDWTSGSTPMRRSSSPDSWQGRHSRRSSGGRSPGARPLHPPAASAASAATAAAVAASTAPQSATAVAAASYPSSVAAAATAAPPRLRHGLPSSRITRRAMGQHHPPGHHLSSCTSLGQITEEGQDTADLGA